MLNPMNWGAKETPIPPRIEQPPISSTAIQPPPVYYPPVLESRVALHA